MHHTAPALSGCENPGAVSWVPCTLKLHLPALLSLASLWLCGVPMGLLLPGPQVGSKVLCVFSPLIYQGCPLLSISGGGRWGRASHRPSSVSPLSDFTPPREDIRVGGAKPQTPDTGVRVSQRGQVLLVHSDTVSSGPTQQSATHMATSRIRQKVDFCHGLGCAQNGWDDWRSGLAMDLIRQRRYQPPLLLLSSTEPTVDAGGRGGGFCFLSQVTICLDM